MNATNDNTTPSSYSAGYQDGMHFGARCANERYFWIGLVVGVVVAAIVVLAVLNLTGALK